MLQVKSPSSKEMGFSDKHFVFVNNVRTKDGGTHETGPKPAIHSVMNDYASKTGLQEKDKT